MTGNDNERVQAVRVVRRLMCLNAAQFPVALARTLVAIASGVDDRLINVTLAALAELCKYFSLFLHGIKNVPSFL